MGTKTKFGFAAFVATGLIASAGFAYADAQAQEGDTEILIAPQPETADAPVFISEEVVQPLPETAETDAAAETDDVEAAFANAKSLRELMAEVAAELRVAAEAARDARDRAAHVPLEVGTARGLPLGLPEHLASANPDGALLRRRQQLSTHRPTAHLPPAAP